MLVTNILLGIIIVVLFAILDRLGDMYYADEPESIQMTKEELKAWLKEKDLEEKLNATLNEWLTKYNHQPTFYYLDNIEKVRLEVVAE